MNTTLLERFLKIYFFVFFCLRFSDESIGAISIFDIGEIQTWAYYVMPLAIAGLYIIITTAGKKSDKLDR
jgi:hypothetical protein